MCAAGLAAVVACLLRERYAVAQALKRPQLTPKCDCFQPLQMVVETIGRAWL